MGAEEPNEIGAYTEVSNTRGFLRLIPIDDGRLAEHQQEDGGPTTMALCQQLVDDLAGEIRTHLNQAQAQ